MYAPIYEAPSSSGVDSKVAVPQSDGPRPGDDARPSVLSGTPDCFDLLSGTRHPPPPLLRGRDAAFENICSVHGAFCTPGFHKIGRRSLSSVTSVPLHGSLLKSRMTPAQPFWLSFIYLFLRKGQGGLRITLEFHERPYAFILFNQ